jgi:hypothetical protein
MTPQQAADGLIELLLPEGRSVLVDFRDRAAGDPEIEADVIRIMLDAEEPDGDICAAVGDYAESSGLAATYYLGAEALIVTLGEPL